MKEREEDTMENDVDGQVRLLMVETMQHAIFPQLYFNIKKLLNSNLVDTYLLLFIFVFLII